MRSTSKKEQILQAALQIIVAQGAGKLSFDTLSERTGITKSGILYHFPAKTDLFQALTMRAYAPFFARYKELVSDQSPSQGRTVLGYIRSLVEGCGEGVDTCAAMTAIVSEQPELLAMQRDLYQMVRRDVQADGGNFAEQWAIIAALDGLWFDDMTHIYAISPQERQAIVNHCMQQARAITRKTGQPAAVPTH